MRAFHRGAAIAVALCISSGLAAAQDEAAKATPVVASPSGEELSTTTLDTVVVSGVQPGPGLWKVSKDGHVMWVLGTLAPLPKRMEWNADEVERVIAQSQTVLLGPSVDVTFGGNMFRNMFLLPKAMKARNNPAKEKLVDVLPPALYQRWLTLKQRYMGRDRGVEKRRPLVAAQELMDEALDDVGLSMDTKISKTVRKLAESHDVPVTRPQITMTVADPKQALIDFSQTSLDDIECFSRTLDRIDGEIELMKLRANAWAVGELEILRSLPATDTSRECMQSVLQTRVAKQLGFDDLERQLREAWLKDVEAAIAKNESTFALLSMGLVVREDGFVAALAQRGYLVETPEQVDAAADAADEALDVDAEGTTSR
jgi:hypothetical protein